MTAVATSIRTTIPEAMPANTLIAPSVHPFKPACGRAAPGAPRTVPSRKIHNPSRNCEPTINAPVLHHRVLPRLRPACVGAAADGVGHLADLPGPRPGLYPLGSFGPH